MLMNMQWYQSLNKPIFSPPDWVFAPVWSVLYILMAMSLFAYVKTPSKINKGLGYSVFFIQLVLNLLWTPVFFTFKQIEAGAVICTLLVILVLITIRLFYAVSKISAILLVPYFLWLILAAYLNIEILRLNS